jgi:hypothetical protein
LRVRSLWLRVYGNELLFSCACFGFGVEVLGDMSYDSGFRIQGLGFRVWVRGSGFEMKAQNLNIGV